MNESLIQAYLRLVSEICNTMLHTEDIGVIKHLARAVQESSHEAWQAIRRGE